VAAMAHVPATVACIVVLGMSIVMVGVGAMASGGGQGQRSLIEAFAFARVCVVMSVGHRCTSCAAVPASGSMLSSAPMARVSVIN
jgi:hypothetical protein